MVFRLPGLRAVAPLLLMAAVAAATIAGVLSPVPVYAADAASFAGADQVVQWSNRYYQHPQPERIPNAVAVLIADPRFTNPNMRLEPFARFLSTALISRPDLIAKVGALSNQTNPQAKRFVTLVVSQAKAYRATAVNDPGDLDLVWSEYFATGDEARLQRIAGVLDYTPKRIDLSSAFWRFKSIQDPERALTTLKATAMWSLSSNAKQDERVKQFLQRQRDTAKTAQKRTQFVEMLDGRITMPR